MSSLTHFCVLLLLLSFVHKAFCVVVSPIDGKIVGEGEESAFGIHFPIRQKNGTYEFLSIPNLDPHNFSASLISKLQHQKPNLDVNNEETQNLVAHKSHEVKYYYGRKKVQSFLRSLLLEKHLCTNPSMLCDPEIRAVQIGAHDGNENNPFFEPYKGGFPGMLHSLLPRRSELVASNLPSAKAWVPIHLLLVEPVPMLMAALQANHAADSKASRSQQLFVYNASFAPTAVCPENGESTFFLPRVSEKSDTMQRDAFYQNNWDLSQGGSLQKRVVERFVDSRDDGLIKIKVNCTTYKTLLDTYGWKTTPIDIVVIDTEGQDEDIVHQIVSAATEASAVFPYQYPPPSPPLAYPLPRLLIYETLLFNRARRARLTRHLTSVGYDCVEVTEMDSACMLHNPKDNRHPEPYPLALLDAQHRARGDAVAQMYPPHVLVSNTSLIFRPLFQPFQAPVPIPGIAPCAVTEGEGAVSTGPEFFTLESVPGREHTGATWGPSRLARFQKVIRQAALAILPEVRGRLAGTEHLLRLAQMVHEQLRSSFWELLLEELEWETRRNAMEEREDRSHGTERCVHATMEFDRMQMIAVVVNFQLNQALASPERMDAMSNAIAPLTQRFLEHMPLFYRWMTRATASFGPFQRFGELDYFPALHKLATQAEHERMEYISAHPTSATDDGTTNAPFTYETVAFNTQQFPALRLFTTLSFLCIPTASQPPCPMPLFHTLPAAHLYHYALGLYSLHPHYVLDDALVRYVREFTSQLFPSPRPVPLTHLAHAASLLNHGNTHLRDLAHLRALIHPQELLDLESVEVAESPKETQQGAFSFPDFGTVRRCLAEGRRNFLIIHPATLGSKASHSLFSMLSGTTQGVAVPYCVHVVTGCGESCESTKTVADHIYQHELPLDKLTTDRLVSFAQRVQLYQFDLSWVIHAPATSFSYFLTKVRLSRRTVQLLASSDHTTASLADITVYTLFKDILQPGTTSIYTPFGFQDGGEPVLHAPCEKYTDLVGPIMEYTLLHYFCLESSPVPEEGVMNGKVCGQTTAGETRCVYCKMDKFLESSTPYAGIEYAEFVLPWVAHSSMEQVVRAEQGSSSLAKLQGYAAYKRAHWERLAQQFRGFGIAQTSEDDDIDVTRDDSHWSMGMFDARYDAETISTVAHQSFPLSQFVTFHALRSVTATSKNPYPFEVDSTNVCFLDSELQNGTNAVGCEEVRSCSVPLLPQSTNALLQETLNRVQDLVGSSSGTRIVQFQKDLHLPTLWNTDQELMVLLEAIQNKTEYVSHVAKQVSANPNFLVGGVLPDASEKKSLRFTPSGSASTYRLEQLSRSLRYSLAHASTTKLTIAVDEDKSTRLRFTIPWESLTSSQHPQLPPLTALEREEFVFAGTQEVPFRIALPLSAALSFGQFQKIMVALQLLQVQFQQHWIFCETILQIVGSMQETEVCHWTLHNWQRASRAPIPITALQKNGLQVSYDPTNLPAFHVSLIPIVPTNLLEHEVDSILLQLQQQLILSGNLGEVRVESHIYESSNSGDLLSRINIDLVLLPPPASELLQSFLSLTVPILLVPDLIGGGDVMVNYADSSYSSQHTTSILNRYGLLGLASSNTSEWSEKLVAMSMNPYLRALWKLRIFEAISSEEKPFSNQKISSLKAILDGLH